MKFTQRLLGHTKTIARHRREVRKLMALCGLNGRRHDLSKYSPIEFWNGVKYYTGTSSPHVGERKVKGYSDAWLHHKSRNRHHSEYWIDIINGDATPIDMPPVYFVEMLCDRIAASKVYLGADFSPNAPLMYYLTHRDENIMSENTRNLLYVALVRYSRLPEWMFFNWIKEMLADPYRFYEHAN